MQALAAKGAADSDTSRDMIDSGSILAAPKQFPELVKALAWAAGWTPAQTSQQYARWEMRRLAAWSANESPRGGLWWGGPCRTT